MCVCVCVVGGGILGGLSLVLFSETIGFLCGTHRIKACSQYLDFCLWKVQYGGFQSRDAKVRGRVLVENVRIASELPI